MCVQLSQAQRFSRTCSSRQCQILLPYSAVYPSPSVVLIFPFEKLFLLPDIKNGKVEKHLPKFSLPPTQKCAFANRGWTGWSLRSLPTWYSMILWLSFPCLLLHLCQIWLFLPHSIHLPLATNSHCHKQNYSYSNTTSSFWFLLCLLSHSVFTPFSILTYRPTYFWTSLCNLFPK